MNWQGSPKSLVGLMDPTNRFSNRLLMKKGTVLLNTQILRKRQFEQLNQRCHNLNCSIALVVWSIRYSKMLTEILRNTPCLLSGQMDQNGEYTYLGFRKNSISRLFFSYLIWKEKRKGKNCGRNLCEWCHHSPTCGRLDYFPEIKHRFGGCGFFNCDFDNCCLTYSA